MSFNRYVITQPRPEEVFNGLASSVSFVVSLEGMDTLILDCKLSQVSASALQFTFSGKDPNTANDYVLTITDYSSGTIRPAIFTRQSVSGSLNERYVFSIPAAGVPHENSGNIITTITAAGGVSGETLRITPIVARIAG